MSASSSVLIRSSWRKLALKLAAAIALVAASALITRYAWYDLLVLAWNDPESSHVLLVPVVFAWLAWHRRGRLRRDAGGARNCWIGTVFMAVGWVLWWSGYRYEFQSFWHLGAVLMALGAALSVFGLEPLRAWWPAFGVLVFLVPVPAIGRDLVAAPLQRVTAQATQLIAELGGLDIQRTGSLLRINGVDVAIAEACNGMRLVFTLFLACYVFAFVTPLRWPVRLAVLLLSPLVAVCANVTRLVPTVWAYGHVSADAARKFHDATGWAMLVAAFIGLMASVGLLRWAGVPVDPPAPNAAAS